MPLMLKLPHTPRRVHLKSEGGTVIGRNELRNCPERIFVSRHQCALHLQPGGQQALLVHTGGDNPTLVIKSGSEQQLLLKPDPAKQGDRLLLTIGDRFSVIATKPDEAIQLVWEDFELATSASAAEAAATAPAATATAPLADEPVPAPHGINQTGDQQQQQDQQQQPPMAAAGPEVAAVVTATAGAAAAPHPPPGHPVMLLLSGIPGSGKSTFAMSLTAASNRSWVRINQDSIAGGGGKKGTRQQCVRAAAAALAAGRNVIIDRCNVDAGQRVDFVQLARSRGVPVHLLLLSLDPKLCARRAAARSGHEGGVEGKAAARVVWSMAAQARKAAAPAAAVEGLVSVTTCTSDTEVAAALKRWTAAAVGLGRQHVQPSMVSPVATAAAAAVAPAAAAAAAAVPALPAVSGSPPNKRRRIEHFEEGHEHERCRQHQQQQLPAGPAASPGAATTGSRRMAQYEQQQQQQQQQQPVKHSSVSADKGNAFTMMMTAAKHQAKPSAAGSQEQQQQRTPPAAAAALGSGSSGNISGSSSSRQPGGRWSSELAHVAAAPERYKAVQTIWHIDQQVVGLIDKYPKARSHALLLVRQRGLDKVSQLTVQHLPLLNHMRQVALRWIQHQQQAGTGVRVSTGVMGSAAAAAGNAGVRGGGGNGGGDAAASGSSGGGAAAAGSSCAAAAAAAAAGVPAGWQAGFHSVPSMSQLHLHIISTDFDSICLKTKKHWNSFCSPFFLHLADVIVGLEQHGCVNVDVAASEQLLKRPMHCNVCGQQIANIPALKQHLRAHQQLKG